MATFVFGVPLLIFLFKGKNNIGWMVFACVLINIGMWMERYIVIIPTEVSPRMLHVMGQGSYLPALPEILITAACFSGLILLYALFTRFFPIVPIWETAQELPGHAHSGEVSPAATPAGD
jgi:molybdopterin-containing oxidoreductase family membrane subunit